MRNDRPLIAFCCVIAIACCYGIWKAHENASRIDVTEPVIIEVGEWYNNDRFTGEDFREHARLNGWKVLPKFQSD